MSSRIAGVSLSVNVAGAAPRREHHAAAVGQAMPPRRGGMHLRERLGGHLCSSATRRVCVPDW